MKKGPFSQYATILRILPPVVLGNLFERQRGPGSLSPIANPGLWPHPFPYCVDPFQITSLMKFRGRRGGSAGDQPDLLLGCVLEIRRSQQKLELRVPQLCIPPILVRGSSPAFSGCVGRRVCQNFGCLPSEVCGRLQPRLSPT